MRIAILNWRDPKHPLAGGAELSLMEHAKFWRKKGAEVTWYASQFSNAKKKELTNGIRIIRQGTHYTVHWLTYRNFKEALRNSEIIIDCFHGMPYFSPLYLQTKKIIALINEPAKNVWLKNLPPPFGHVAYHSEPHFFNFYRSVPFITSASSIVSELQQFRIPKKNITVIPHGVTLHAMKKHFVKSKTPTIIYLSQLTADKGIEDAIHAFSKVKKKKSSAQFWIVGKAVNQRYQSKLQELVSRLSLADAIQFYGFVSQNKKFELLSRAWILVHPSIREGWGLNVIEANACYTPAVGYNVTGLRDSILHKKTGLLTRKNDSVSLAESVIHLLDNKAEYKKYMENAKKWSRTFDWNNAGELSWRIIMKVYGNNK